MASMHKRATALLVVSSLTLTGCASGKEGIGQAIGGLLAGGICLALVDAKHKEACLLAAAAGFMIGGAIGHQIDVRDRERRERALAATLDDPALWRDHRGTGPLTADVIAAKPLPKAPPQTDTVTPREVTWVNPDTTNSGRIEPLVTYVGGTQGNQECKQIRETYFKAGQPISEVELVCKNAEGKWEHQTA